MFSHKFHTDNVVAIIVIMLFSIKNGRGNYLT